MDQATRPQPSIAERASDNMAIKGAGGKIRGENTIAYSTGDQNPNGGNTVMTTSFPMRTIRRQGRQENLNLRDEGGVVNGNRERNSAIAGT